MSGSYENPHVAPQITLYTFPDCPYCQRIHILLTELKLPFEEVFIDINKPREQWYLDINPRGLVPSLALAFSNTLLTHEILTESSVIAQFICDSRPSHVLPSPTSSPTAPLRRARVQLYVDAFMGKLGSQSRAVLLAEDPEAKVRELVEGVRGDVEPLLKGCGEGEGPFLGGEGTLSLAEILTAPFLLRFYALSSRGILPKSFKQGLEALPHFGPWAEAVIAHPSVKENWDEESVVQRAEAMLAKVKAEA
ncbi:glutathione-S-transferase-like protein omega 1 [Phyllosticta citricarpa]|uniref:Glutathione-S-transferase-like protein omega 1 n=2 Tax=Phyllosticta TaxID=121621 RepID=A0ABR1M2R9_9PEZI